MRKKRRIRSKLDKAKAACWIVVSKAVHERDGKCQICGSTDTLQVDHCFSRAISLLHHDIKNLTLLCRSCHFKKSYCVGGMEKRVDEVVRKREGEDWWDCALNYAKSHKPHKLNIEELETIQMFHELAPKKGIANDQT